MTPPARNAPCPCGSGRKWKKCCGGAERHNAEQAARRARIEAARVETGSAADTDPDLVEARARAGRHNATRTALFAAALLGGGR